MNLQVQHNFSQIATLSIGATRMAQSGCIRRLIGHSKLHSHNFGLRINSPFHKSNTTIAFMASHNKATLASHFSTSHNNSDNVRTKMKPNAKSIEIDENEQVEFSFLERDTGTQIKVLGNVGRTVLDVALDNNVDIEGACGGELACSTCHVIVPPALYKKLPEKKVEEDDMLDLAQEITPTSRLCCQLKVSRLMEGAIFTVPNDSL